jgi:glyoxylate carboligase
MAMGTEIDKLNELEPLAMSIEEAPVVVLQA